MKRALLAGLLVMMLAACDITIVLPGANLVVDGDALSSGRLASGASARFQVLVAARPVRVDVFDLDNGQAGSLLLRAYDSNGALFAQTISRKYFIAPKPEIVASSSLRQGIVSSGAYSLNLQAGSGEMYIEVTNLSDSPTRVSVRAVSRGPQPPDGDFSASVSGALLFLGQLDHWTYNGAAGATLKLAGGEMVHALARVSDGSRILARLEPGDEYNGLEPGDVVFVQAQGNGALAGFCDDGIDGNEICNDGLHSGEYTLEVH